MDQISRIIRMEAAFDKATAVVEALSAALEDYSDTAKDLQQLFDYYFGPQWMQDLEADQSGKLPSGLKRGVLSEDGVYNLFLQNRELLLRLKDLANST